MRLTSSCENESQHAGKKRTRTEIENIDDGDVPAHKTSKHHQPDATAWRELDNILSSMNEPSIVQAASKSSDVQESSPYILSLIMTQKELCDELAIAYAEKILPLLPNLANEACSGCKNNIDRNTYAQQHDVCPLPRKKCIDLFTEMALISIDASLVHIKVITRLKSRHAMFDKTWVHKF